MEVQYQYPLISVIVPVFNIRKYLDKCLHSIRNQTYLNVQIILVDDGSTDGSDVICDRHGDEDDRICVIHKENGGLVSARKTGMKRATGQYVTFVDGDDWIDENMLEKIVPCLLGNSAVDIVAFGLIEEYTDYQLPKYNVVSEGVYKGKRLEHIKDCMFMGDIFFEWRILPHLCDKVIRTSILKDCIKNISERISFGEDVACSYPCILKASSLVSLKITPYHYRQREGSITKSTVELSRDRFYELYGTLSQAFKYRELLSEQLKYYMFFVLLLKAYSEIESKMLLFPFKKVVTGDCVYVYGAGGFGKVIKSYIEENKDLGLAGWSDGNASFYRNSGYQVDSIEAIYESKFDQVVIAILNEDIAIQIKEELVKGGIPSEKIDFVQKSVLNDKNLPSWLIPKTI